MSGDTGAWIRDVRTMSGYNFSILFKDLELVCYTQFPVSERLAKEFEERRKNAKKGFGEIRSIVRGHEKVKAKQNSFENLLRVRMIRKCLCSLIEHCNDMLVVP